MMCKAGKNNNEIRAYIREYEKRYPNWNKCEIVNRIGKAKKMFLICAKYKQVLVMKLLGYLHTRMVGS